jgi:transmembrane sensor
MTVRAQEIQDELLEQAAAWVVRLRADPSNDELERFDAWRSQSEFHARAYEDASAAWSAVGEHATASRLLEMRRDALDRAAPKTGWWERRSLVAALLLVVLVPVLGIGGWRLWQARSTHEFQTARGEQRVIVLPDGSRLSLDAMSRVAVNYTPDIRGITLIAGRANFEVVKDVTRPLKVYAGPRTVTAIGTVFTVEREPREVSVSLIEGRVAVTSSTRAAGTVEMHPRQQIRMTDAGDMTSHDGLDSTQMLAWRDGKLIFDNEPLAKVAARMNNYAATPLEIEGEARNLRISGVFKAGDTGAFVDAMESYFSLTAQHRDDAIELRLK